MPADDTKIQIIFRGVRGSHPMPGASTLRYGGNTTSQEIRVGGRLIIFDAGTGIISLGHDIHKANGPRTMAIFFSHNHHDHIGGILYFRPAYQPSTTMHLFGPADGPGSIMDALESISAPAAHPIQFGGMGMKYTSTILDNGDVVAWRPGAESPVLLAHGEKTTAEDVVVRVLKNPLHPREGVLNFRLEYGGKSYVYATDVEGNEEKGDALLAEFSRGADLIAHDGQYTSEEYSGSRKGWGHSTIRMAIRTARMAHIPRIAIIHHEPLHGDDQLDAMEKEGQNEFPGVFLAREGQTVEV